MLWKRQIIIHDRQWLHSVLMTGKTQCPSRGSLSQSVGENAGFRIGRASTQVKGRLNKPLLPLHSARTPRTTGVCSGTCSMPILQRYVTPHGPHRTGFGIRITTLLRQRKLILVTGSSQGQLNPARCQLQIVKSTQDFQDVKASGFSLGAHLCVVTGASVWCYSVKRVHPEALPGTPRLMALWSARCCSPWRVGVGKGPLGAELCCIRSPNAVNCILWTSTFLGIPSGSSALSLTFPQSKVNLGAPESLVGGLCVPHWPESLASCCLGQPRGGRTKILFVSPDQT